MWQDLGPWLCAGHQGGKSICERSLLSSCMEQDLKEKNAKEGTLYRAELLDSVKKKKSMHWVRAYSLFVNIAICLIHRIGSV